MPSIRILQFGGIRPAVEVRLLPLQYAQVAHNTELRRGNLCPYKAPTRKRACDGDSIFLTPFFDNGEKLLCETDACMAVAYRSCQSTDDVAIFYQDDRDPVVVDENDGRYPLLPIAPTQAPGVTVVTQEPPKEYVGPDERFYVYTWVMEDGTESRPSPPSRAIRVREPVEVELTFQPPPPRAIAIRIYRNDSPIESSYGADGNATRSTLQLVRDIEPPVTDWTDNVRMKDMEMGALLTTDNCDPPPMECVKETEAGYLVGFSGRYLMFSEIGEPHNWPERSRIELPHRIVGIAVHQDDVYVGTTGHPFRVRIAQPEGEGNIMQRDIDRYDDYMPLKHMNAITPTDTGAAMSTIGGVAHLDPGQAYLRTRARIDEDIWDDEFAPSHLYWQHERLFGWGGPIGGFILGWQGGENLDIGDVVTIGWDPTTAVSGYDGKMYYLEDGTIWTWDTGEEPLPYRWKSRVYRAQGWMKWAAAKVVGEQTVDNPVTFRLYGDGELYYEKDVTDISPFRLPCGHRAIDWEIELEGTACVREVHVATSKQELTETGGSQQ